MLIFGTVIEDAVLICIGLYVLNSLYCITFDWKTSYEKQRERHKSNLSRDQSK